MAGLGILIGWFGYSVMYYGLTQVQGGNWGYLDMIVPGRWTSAVANTPKDSGQAATTKPITVTKATGPQKRGGGGPVTGGQVGVPGQIPDKYTHPGR